jgi:hypothetical protein
MKNTKEKFILKPNNNSLTYFLKTFQNLSKEEKKVTELIPYITKSFEEIIQNEVSFFIKPSIKLFKRRKNYRLCNSFFDNILAASFNEFAKYLHNDYEKTSLIIDSILFQFNGTHTSTPEENDFINRNTQNFRGIAKYASNNKRLKENTMIPDPTDWLIGVEVSTILTGNADIRYVVSASTKSKIANYDSIVILRELFYDEKPNAKKRDEFIQMLNENLRAMTEKISSI